VHSQKAYFPTLDGWRGLSVLAVILYHGRFGFFGIDSPLTRLTAHGDLGVEVFFAISGFLICDLLLRELARTGEISLRRFYLRRCFRILPAYYTALAGICLIGLLASVPVNYADLPSCLLFYRNWRPLGMDHQGGFYTAHFWTLAVEEHFYLVWPMVLTVVKPKRAGATAFVLAMLLFGLNNIVPSTNLIISTETRIFAILWGCLAAIYFPTIRQYAARIPFPQLWLPLLALLLAVEKLRPHELTLFRAVLLPALVVSTVVQPASVLGRVLEWWLLRWIGVLSYSLYLWQELFLPELHAAMAQGSFRYLQQWPWNLPALLACACLSRYLIERPMIRLGHRLSERLLVSGSAFPMVRVNNHVFHVK
jgi:peptidoglycan/LPS O-acetylase OafA/YrhL